VTVGGHVWNIIIKIKSVPEQK